MKKLIKTSKKRIIFKKKSSKKAQFFLMAAIIIVMVLYTLTINYNWIKESVELSDYAELRDNYNTEVPKVINRAIFITTNPADCSGTSPPDTCPLKAVSDFSTQFKKYASNKDPNFGLVSVFRDPYSGDIIVKNLLAGDKYIKIDASDYGGEGIKILWSEDARAPGSINLNIGGHSMFATTVSAPISYYGENLTKANLGNVPKFEVCIPECMTINTETIASTTTVTDTKNDQGAIDVDVCPPQEGVNLADTRC